MERHRKGDLTEAIVIAELKERNIPVSKPFGDNERYDLLAEAPDGSLLRIQVKTGRFVNGSVFFEALSQLKNSSGTVYESYAGDVDYFIVYSERFDSLYLIEADGVNTGMHLRVDDPKIDHPSINWASDFEFDRCWPSGNASDSEIGRPDQDLPTNRRGDATEARAIAELLSREISIAIPPTDNERFDLVLQSQAGDFYRIQVKTGWMADGCVTFRAASSHVNAKGVVHKPYDDDIDFFLVYEPTLDEMYLIAEDEIHSAIYLRVDESKQPDRTAHHAEDFLFDRNWPPQEAPPRVRSDTRPKYHEIWNDVFDRFEELGAIVSEPIQDDAPYDIVAETPDGAVVRCGLRIAQLKEGRIFFNPDIGSEEQVDYFILYCYDLDQLYLINSSIVDSSITLRVEEPKQLRRVTLRAEDYELERQWPPSSGSRIPKSILLDIGIEAFEALGVKVAYPATQDNPCDILVGSADGRFLRVAIEPGWIWKRRIRLKPKTCDGIDYFLLICRELDTSYLIGVDEFNVSISLRVEPPKRTDVPIHCAEDYELAVRWPVESK